MSAAIPSPGTNRVVRGAQTAQELFNAAEQNPVAKADLQMLFDSISHGAPWTGGLVTIAGIELAQHNITVDNQLLTLVIGGAATLASYAYQWVRIKMTKPPLETNS